ncbi:MAG: hypothetical protein GTO41_20140 [Burkholderiales bacterium]|nr:hypothetical protein [Burkholderiales bacterium]
MFDRGDFSPGHRTLGNWLSLQQGQGSEWVHLHFHMAVFELALGQWDEAYRRFLAHVLPTATGTAEALTDAPALLWRLAITAREPVVLPWQPLRRTALANLQRSNNPFTQIHHLLALAGAGDRHSIQEFSERQLPRTSIVRRFATACDALAKRAYSQAREQLSAVLPDLGKVGGSHAQQGIFEQLAIWTGRAADRPRFYGLGLSID